MSDFHGGERAFELGLEPSHFLLDQLHLGTLLLLFDVLVASVGRTVVARSMVLHPGSLSRVRILRVSGPS